jgi:hypothetical protein
MRGRIVVVPVVALVFVAGCGGAGSSKAVTSATLTATSSSAVASSARTAVSASDSASALGSSASSSALGSSASSSAPGPSATPLSSYASRYLAIVTPALQAVTAFEGMHRPATDAQIKAGFAIVKEAVDACDVALLSVAWPGKAEVDVRSLVRDDATELADFEALNLTKASSDGSVLRRDANLVRADLGLPPAES